MALRTSAFLVLGTGAAIAAADQVCPDATSPYIGFVTSYSEKCFQNCPAVCGELDGAITEYMSTQSTAGIKDQVCDNMDKWACMFLEANFKDECEKVLKAGADFNIKLPMSQAELDEECGSVGDAGDDSDGAGEGEDNATTAAPASGGSDDGATGGTGGNAAGNGGGAGKYSDSEDSDLESAAPALAFASAIPLALAAAIRNAIP